VGLRSLKRRLGAFGVLALAATGCTDAAGYDLDYIMGRVPFLSTMRRSVAFEAQSMPRLPAPGTVPVSSPNGVIVPVFAQAQLDSAAATLTNPVATSPEVIARGAAVYANQCFACHGAEAAGTGPVVGVGRFPIGPALNGDATAGRSDGYIYSVIRVGRALMPSYGDRVGDSDRWAIVHYLRQLQQQGGAVAAPVAAAPVGTPGDTSAAPGTPVDTTLAPAPPAAGL
jgi:mono/diheme cytochrome c family protein